MGQPRELESSERVFSDPFLSVRRERLVAQGTGAVKHALLIEIADWVNVVALDDDDRVLLVRQFRFGTREETLEIPGGGVDPGETSLQAARRELMEETGFEASTWEQVGVTDPNPAIQGNHCTTFVARGLKRAADFDADEIDGLEVVPLTEVRRRISAGQIRHALVIVAIHFAVAALEQGSRRADEGKGSEGAGL